MEVSFASSRSCAPHTSAASSKDNGEKQSSATAPASLDTMTEEDYKVLMGTLREVGNPLTFSRSATAPGLSHARFSSFGSPGVGFSVSEGGGTAQTPQGSTDTVVSRAMLKLLGGEGGACDTPQDWEERRAHRHKRLTVGNHLREAEDHDVVKGEEVGEGSQEAAKEVNARAQGSQCGYQQDVNNETCFLFEPSPLQEIQILHQGQATVDRKRLLDATDTGAKKKESGGDMMLMGITSGASSLPPAAATVHKAVLCISDLSATSGMQRHCSRNKLLHAEGSDDHMITGEVDDFRGDNEEVSSDRKQEENTDNMLKINATDGVNNVEEVNEMRELRVDNAKSHQETLDVHRPRSFRLKQAPAGVSANDADSAAAKSKLTPPLVAAEDSHDAGLETQLENPRRAFKLSLSTLKHGKVVDGGERECKESGKEALAREGQDLFPTSAVGRMVLRLEVGSANTQDVSRNDNKVETQTGNTIVHDFGALHSSDLPPPRHRTLSLGFKSKTVREKELGLVNTAAEPDGSSPVFSPCSPPGSRGTGMETAVAPGTADAVSAKVLISSPVHLPAVAVPPAQGSGPPPPSSPISAMLRMVTPTPTPSVAHSAANTPCRRHRITRVPLPSAPPTIDISTVKRVLEDYYQLDRKISEGVYGVVYIGTDKRTNDQVALKRLKVLRGLDGFPYTSLREVIALQHINRQRARLAKEGVQGESSEQLLIKKNDCQEAQSTGARAEEDPLKEVVTLRDVLISREGPHDIFLVFNYASCSMAGILVRHFPLVLPEVAYIFRSLVIATMKLHAMGIIHRDIKSDNVLLMKDGTVKLIDFGLCAFEDSGRAALTPSMINLSYRPPEMLLGSVVYNTKVDVWSIGCFLAQIFLHHPPFHKRRSADEQEHTARYNRTAETELEQLALIAEVLGPITQVSPDAFPAETCNHLKHLQKIKERIEAGLAYGTSSKCCNNSGPSTARLEALFQPSFLYTQYGGFRRWFIAEMENRRVQYTRRWQNSFASTPPSVHSPQPPLLLPSPACLDVLCAIFQYDPRRRPTAAQLLSMPFFELLDEGDTPRLGFTVLPQSIPYIGGFSSLSSSCFDNKELRNERELRERVQRVQNSFAKKLQGFLDSHIKPKS